MRLSERIAVLGAFFTVVGCGPQKAPPPVTLAPPEPSASETRLATVEERARMLSQLVLVVDGHIDLPYRLEAGRDAAGSLTEDPTVRTEKGDFDWERAREGGLDAPFMSIYIPAKHQTEGGGKALADRLIDMVEGLEKRAPEKFAVARSPTDVHAAFKERKVALPLGIENGAAIEGKLENLEHFHARGVRYITLTHAKDNDICDSSYDDAHTHKGLSPLGKQVVVEMNRLGIMVDVSHISDDAFWQVIELSKAPVIASHSSCRHFTPGFERNMSDAMIQRLAERDGVIMINYGSTFVTKAARAWSDAVKPAREAFMQESGIEDRHDERVKTWYAQYKVEHPLPFATVRDVADHIMHVVKLVGVDHVGLGSDFDGVGDSLPVGLKDPSALPNLIAELLRRDLTPVDVAKICGLNVMRVWEAVEQFAATSQD